MQIDAQLRQLLTEVTNIYRSMMVDGDLDNEWFISHIRTNINKEPLTRTEIMESLVHSLMLIQSIDRAAEVEFHKQRRMFYIIGDLVKIAEAGDARSHAEWMQEEGDYDSFAEAIRGYADGTGLYAYKGSDYILGTASESDFYDHIGQLVTELNLDADLEVFAGVRPGVIGVRWEGRKKMGKVRDIMRW